MVVLDFVVVVEGCGGVARVLGGGWGEIGWFVVKLGGLGLVLSKIGHF